ncbi:unnamed protein product [Soboliphyme baturini]|uniref:ANK_REP_REGION domain-containing protein n=1 Tax=Soboliphyme baturini TaxID=241478 RepID=A0A183J593_9BILA|nr:unnamed protein product [Soboliphyme baturini]
MHLHFDACSVSPDLDNDCFLRRGRSQRLPLFDAIINRDFEKVMTSCILLADVNAVDHQKNTPLLRALKDSEVCWDIVEVLLQCGAKIKLDSDNEVSPVDLMPELQRLQAFIVTYLVQVACRWSNGRKELSPPFVSGRKAANIRRDGCDIRDRPSRPRMLASRSFFTRKFKNKPEDVRSEEMDGVKALSILSQMATNDECSLPIITALLSEVEVITKIAAKRQNDKVYQILLSSLLAQILMASGKTSGSSKRGTGHLADVVVKVVEFASNILGRTHNCMEFAALYILSKVGWCHLQHEDV